jgi:AcrR family transcriptional regulator
MGAPARRRDAVRQEILNGSQPGICCMGVPCDEAPEQVSDSLVVGRAGQPNRLQSALQLAAPFARHRPEGAATGGDVHDADPGERWHAAAADVLPNAEQMFRILFMCAAGDRSDDLTARARIRDAAVELIGRDGFEAVKIRAVAGHADVSPGLVIHHFGSKDGLRAACERYVGDRIHEAIELAAARLQPYDLFDEVSRKLELAHLLPFLLRALSEGGDLGRRLFNRLVDDTEKYLRAGVAQGVIRPSDDERGRAEMLVSFSLGSQLLAQYLVTADTAHGRVEQLQRRFTLPALEVFTHGLYTSTEVMAGHPEQPPSPEADTDPPSGPAGQPRHRQPNAPAGDPPAPVVDQQRLPVATGSP